jgi:hypothetical protein
MSTHDKQMYCVEIGRKLIFMARPRPTRNKHYREPIVIDVRYYRTKAEMLTAKLAYKA